MKKRTRGPAKQFEEQILVPINSRMRNAVEYVADSRNISMAEVVREAIQETLRNEIAQGRCPEELQA